VARHKQAYAGEHRTRAIGVKLTPAERAKLEAAAAARGEGLSEYIRELCFRRSPPTVGGVSRNPDARALAHELSRIGNNLNQLAKVANTKGATPHFYELKMVTGMVKAAIQRVLEL
jgi:hypothetical protein